MRHGHASLGLQARTGVEARVRRLGQGWGARVSSQRETVLLDLLVSVLTYYSYFTAIPAVVLVSHSGRNGRVVYMDVSVCRVA